MERVIDLLSDKKLFDKVEIKDKQFSVLQIKRMAYSVLRWYNRPIDIDLVYRMYHQAWQRELLAIWFDELYISWIEFEDKKCVYLTDSGLKYIECEIFDKRLPFKFVRRASFDDKFERETYFMASVKYIAHPRQIKVSYLKSFDLNNETYELTENINEAFKIPSKHWRDIKLIDNTFLFLRKLEMLKYY